MDFCEQTFQCRVNVSAHAGGPADVVLWCAHACSASWRVCLRCVGQVRAQEPLLHHCWYHPWHLSTCLNPNSPYAGLQSGAVGQMPMLAGVMLHLGTLRSLFWTVCSERVALFWAEPQYDAATNKYVTATYVSFLLASLPSRLQQWYPQEH